MFKRNVFKILAMVFFLLAGATLYNSNKEIPKKVVTNKLVNKKKVSPSISHRPQLSPTIYNNLKPFTTSEPNQPTQIIVNPTNTPIPTQTTTPYNNSTKLTVSLTVAGSSIGSFEIPQGANQCDVLTQALSQGKLQSLNMRYLSDMSLIAYQYLSIQIIFLHLVPGRISKYWT